MRFEGFGALLLEGELFLTPLQFGEQVLEFSLKAIGAVIFEERSHLLTETVSPPRFNQTSCIALSDALRFKGTDITTENGGRVPARVPSQRPANRQFAGANVLKVLLGFVGVQPFGLSF